MWNAVASFCRFSQNSIVVHWHAIKYKWNDKKVVMSKPSTTVSI